MIVTKFAWLDYYNVQILWWYRQSVMNFARVLKKIAYITSLIMLLSSNGAYFNMNMRPGNRELFYLWQDMKTMNRA